MAVRTLYLLVLAAGETVKASSRGVTKTNACERFFCCLMFWFKILNEISPFCGATDTLSLDFWWCLLWVSKLGWIPHLYVMSPLSSFTSGVTPADLFMASMAAETYWSTYMYKHWRDLNLGSSAWTVCDRKFLFVDNFRRWQSHSKMQYLSNVTVIAMLQRRAELCEQARSYFLTSSLHLHNSTNRYSCIQLHKSFTSFLSMARLIFTSVGTIKLGEEISAADGKQTSSGSGSEPDCVM